MLYITESPEQRPKMTSDRTDTHSLGISWWSTFKYFDKTDSGRISIDDLLSPFHSLGCKSCLKELFQNFRRLGLEEDEEIDYPTFVKLMQANRTSLPVLSRSDVKSIFSTVDIDRSSYLTAAKVRHFLTRMRLDLEDTEISEMIAMYDVDGNNQISVLEFEEIFTRMGFIIQNENDYENNRDSQKQGGAKLEENKACTLPCPEVDCADKYINLSEMPDQAVDAFRLFDPKNSGKVKFEDLERAAELLEMDKKEGLRRHDDVALHWDPNREVRGLGSYLHKVNHVALIVTDVGRSARFYSDIVGLQQIRRPNFDKHGAWFTMGNIELHLIKGRPLVHDGKDLIVNHISIETSDIKRIPNALRKLGVPFRQNVSVPKGEDAGMGGTNVDNKNSKIVEQYFFRDPDGYYLEVCNCDELTNYCLGNESELNGYDELVKPLSLENASILIHLVHKWCEDARYGTNFRRDNLETVKGSNGSIKAIADVLGCKQAEKVDEQLLKSYLVRMSVYGDICQNETEQSLRNILLYTNNSSKAAEDVMHMRAAYNGSRIFQPPAFYEEGTKFVKPPAFAVSYSG